MNFAGSHIDMVDSVAGAIMMQHFAQKCSDDVANAVMSAHLAAKCVRASFNDKIYYRYF